MDGMRCVFIFFGLLVGLSLITPPALALSCAPSFRVLMECDETVCSKGFIILIGDGICEGVYRIEDATPEGLQKLYDEEAVSYMDIPRSILDFDSREDQGAGVYEASEDYVPITVDRGQENAKKTEFKSLEEAKEYWRHQQTLAYMFLWSAVIVDGLIFLIAFVTLYLSIKDFRVKYLYGQAIAKKPIAWQFFVWLCSWFSLFLVIGLYKFRLTALLFFIVPIIWVVEIFAFAVFALRRKFYDQQAGSPPPRG